MAFVRVNLRCAACGWVTSRGKQDDDDYGVCRCGGVLREPSHRLRRKRPAPEPALLYQTHDALWPELVAAELARIAGEQR